MFRGSLGTGDCGGGGHPRMYQEVGRTFGSPFRRGLSGGRFNWPAAVEGGLLDEGEESGNVHVEETRETSNRASSVAANWGEITMRSARGCMASCMPHVRSQAIAIGSQYEASREVRDTAAAFGTDTCKFTVRRYESASRLLKVVV